MKHNKNEKKTKLTRRSVSLLLALVLMTSAFAPGAAYATEGFGPARKQVASKEIVEVPEETAAPETVAPETTVPEVTFPERVPTETTAPAETLPEEVLEVDPAYAQAIADLDALAEEAKTLADGLDAEAEDYVDQLTEKCNDFYDRLLERLNGIADMWDANEITKEEYDFAEGKILEIVQGLKERYGYQNRGIATLETVDTLIEGTSAATGLDGRAYHLILMRGHLALQDVVNEVSSTSTDATTGETVTSEYTRIGLSRINQQDIDTWTFISAGADGEYYIKSESSEKYLTFNKSVGNATLSDTPVVTYVRYADVAEDTTLTNHAKKNDEPKVVTHTWRLYSFIQVDEEETAYVLNQYGGSDFTKFPNVAAFNDSDSVLEDTGNLFLLKEPVSKVGSAGENINMSLFNYGSLITSDQLNFLHGNSYGTDGVDGVKNGSGTAKVMEKTLVNGYPKQQVRADDESTTANEAQTGISYDYLFNLNKVTTNENAFYSNVYPAQDTKVNDDITYTYNENDAVTAYVTKADTESDTNNVYDYKSAYFPVSNSDGSGTGLFRKDVPGYEGYYVYDSAVNAAWYNPESNKFELYDYVIRPPYTGFLSQNTTTKEWEKSSDATIGNFLPFNQGHVAGHEDYGTFADPNATQSGTLDAYRLDGTDQASDVDLWFGMSLDFEFNMPKDGIMDGKEMEFDFHGDDDVYVYIDDVLVLDIGGTHAALSGLINFASGEVKNPAINANMLGAKYLASGVSPASGVYSTTTLRQIFEDSGKYTSAEITEMFGAGDTFKDWTRHKLNFFYMERGGNISYCRLRFNMIPLPPGGVSVAKELSEDSIQTAVTQNDEYTFALYEIMETGDTVTEKAVSDMPYIVNGVADSAYVTDENGVFKIKANEVATFSGLETDNTSTSTGKKYRVREIIDPDPNYELAGLRYTGNGAGFVGEDYVDFTIQPNDESNKITHGVAVTNKLKTTDFTVNKTVTGNLGDWSKEFAFTAEIYTAEGGTKLTFPAPEADETYYTVDENGTAHFMLHHDQSHTFDDIPLGAYVVVTEEAAGYDASVTWTYRDDEVVKTSSGITVASFVTTLDDPDENEDNAVAFTNNKTATIETGVVLDSLPYILILGGVVVVAVFLFIRRRRAYED